MFNPGEKLTLRNGKVVTYIAIHPNDGALHIGEFIDADEDITEFETFERSDVLLIEGKPKPMRDFDRLNFVIPVVTDFDSDDTRSRAELLKAWRRRVPNTSIGGRALIDEVARLHGFQF